MEGWTVPAVLAARVRSEPDGAALAECRDGGAAVMTWAEFGERVRDLALALRDAGVTAGERVAIMADPSADYVVAEHATWLAGGISVGIYPTSLPSEIAYQLRDSGARVAMVQGGEHLERVEAGIGLLGDAPAPLVVLLHAGGGPASDGAAGFSLSELRRRGAACAAGWPRTLDELAAERDPGDGLCIVYTSGTTGSPKGVLHSHRSFLYATDGLVDPGLPELRLAEQRIVAHLPLAHVVGKLLTITLPLVSRVVPYITPDSREPVEAFRAVGPTYVLQPPRFLARSAAALLASVETTGRARRALYGAAMRVGRAVVKRRWRGAEPSPPVLLAWRAARALVFRPLLRRRGYHDVRWVQTGSALVPPELAALWQAWGVDLRIVYGLSESGGHVTAQQRPFPAPFDVGEPLRRPDWEVRLAGDGEILLCCPSLFSAYWGKPEATAEVLADGWLHTGDIGEWTETGGLWIFDRKKDIIITSGGKSISPLQIENALKASRYIAESVAVANGRKYVSALIEVDEAATAEWARRQGMAAASYAELAVSLAIRELIASEVARANERLSRVEQVKRFALLPVRLEDEAGLLTPTRKVRRRNVEQRFGELVESLYSAEDDVAIQAQVRGLLRDGA